jgi:Tol biopolymer transport system component
MSLATGTKLGPYEILSALGAGGMGEVYRARDTKLGRDVALKILPGVFATDPDRLARFQREAQVLASLNHPNIGHIYGLEETDGVRALVLELVEGPTLADRVVQGPIPIDEALRIARQIAEALDAAHEQGVIHRDLKPANIKVRENGTVKVLDFGLAKLAAPDTRGAGGMAGLSQSPTVTSPAATLTGVILGTAAYMAPEQARGKAVDKRADIWAFGVVLYEMFTGQRLFEGETVSDTLIEVATKEPDWNRVPAKVHRLLRRCLEKDPKKRLRDIGEAWFVFEDAPQAGTVQAVSPHAWWRTAGWVAALAVFAIALASLAFIHFRETPPVAEVVRFQIPPPGKSDIAGYSVVVSPDGRRVAFVAPGAGGAPQLWVRSLDLLESRPLAGTEGVLIPAFWSPDSRFIGFAVQGKLKKVDVSGGSVQPVCDVPGSFRGGAWSPDGVIIFGTGSLMRVPESGGTATPVTRLDPSRQELFHGGPAFLPDARHFFYFRSAGLGGKNTGIYVGSLDSNPEQQNTKLLVASDQGAVYARVPKVPAQQQDGFLLFFREGSLMAQPFDAGLRELTGEAIPIAEGLGTSTGAPHIGPPQFSASMTGVLAYRHAGALGLNTQLTWFDRQGKNLGTIGEPGEYSSVALSPDGTRVAVAHTDPQAASARAASGNSEIWVYEVGGGTSTQLTFDHTQTWFPVWSRDSSRIIFSSGRDGAFNPYQKASSGAGSEDAVFKSSEYKFVQDWSPDERFLMYSQADGPNIHLWMLPLEGERKPTPYLKTEVTESQGRFSPDGHYVAYSSNGSGKREIYVQPFPNPQGGKWKVSTGGGGQPRWRRDGKELFYISADSKMMAVEVSTAPVFKAGARKVLFATPILDGGNTNNVTRYDVTADGNKFLIDSVLPETSGRAVTPITVVLNWNAALKK